MLTSSCYVRRPNWLKVLVDLPSSLKAPLSGNIGLDATLVGYLFGTCVAARSLVGWCSENRGLGTISILLTDTPSSESLLFGCCCFIAIIYSASCYTSALVYFFAFSTSYANVFYCLICSSFSFAWCSYLSFSRSFFSI
jgi:hypothetical protein